MSEIFVIGGCHHNMLGVIRSLGEKGIRSLAIIETHEKKPYVAKSCYIKQKWIAFDEQQVLEILRAEQGKYEKKPVVIACADNLSSLLDMHHEELSKYYALPGSEEQGRITSLMNKEAMSRLAAKVGLQVPRSVATDTSLDEEIAVPLPWIIKPLVSKDGKKNDIERIYTPVEWAEYKSRHQTRVQVQQLIEKEFEYQLIGLSLDSDQEFIIPGVSHVIRPQATTNTGFLRYERFDESYTDLLSLCHKFLTKTGYSGLFSMEFLRGKDGIDYFMEINFRNDGNAICVTAAGINLPYLWYLNQNGIDYNLESNIKKVYVMPEFSDIRFVWHGKISLLQWLKDLYKTDRFMEFDKKDQKPFWALLRREFLKLIMKF